MSICSCIAATAGGKPWPVFWQPRPPAKSMYVRPSTSSTRAPSARATTIGGVAIPRGTYCSRAARTRSDDVPCSTAMRRFCRDRGHRGNGHDRRNVTAFLEEWGADVARRDFRLEGAEHVDARDPGLAARARWRARTSS